MLDLLSQDIKALLTGTHNDPFSILGPHDGIIRVFLPGAKRVSIFSKKMDVEIATMNLAHVDGLFEARVEEAKPYYLKIVWPGDEQITEDPYSFEPLLSEYDLHLLSEGRHRDLATCLGAQPITIEGVSGVRFAVWAPNARRVSVVGEFNVWDGRRHPMRLRHGAGIWEIFIPRLQLGQVYKYEILGPEGLLPLKSDPVAREVEIPPRTGSIVTERSATKAAFPPLRETHPHHLDQPLLIYEVHAPSWVRHFDGKSYSWAQLGDRLIPYVIDLGFTHVELLPIMGHPFGGSWGYQPLSQFAPMPELGSPDDFARFVARCHEAGLGVILDWVPAHFPTDTHGLAKFDGTALYEHANPQEGFHQDWNTLIFNLGRNEVREFLIASALFWLEHFGVDGLRVDAVASMLYRDYSRKQGEWVPNQYGGRENLEAISFLQELSVAIKDRCPGALLIAEESTAWPGVTEPTESGGLGFTHKWNMGWMHDTLDYIGEDPINRRYHHDQITFGLVYAFSERFILPISHDEVVHGKRSLLGRMPGDEWQRFANLRAYLSLMWTHPGKKLLFMGCEFGQTIEWNHDSELPWHLLENKYHSGVQGAVRSLNHLVSSEPSLYENDFSPDGFEWVIGDDSEQSVFAFLRLDKKKASLMLVVCNFTPLPRYDYQIGVLFGKWKEVFNSDQTGWGGSGIENAGVIPVVDMPRHGRSHSISLSLPPLATICLRWES